MGIVWCRETVRDRSLDVSGANGGSASRSFLVRVDDPGTSLQTILDEPGVLVGDMHPNQLLLAVDTISVKASDDTGMLYTVTVSYKPKPAPEGSGSGEEEQPGGLDGLVPVWGGSSGVSSQPVFKDASGTVMTNSAGDPLEGLEAEQATFHLTKTTYYTSHAGGGGWLAHARQFTNAVNSVAWNGGDEFTWKCQGCSAKLNIDRQGNSPRVYWEVTWDFAYRAETWLLDVWDIGFNELVDADGDPLEVEGISAGRESPQAFVYEEGGGSGGPAPPDPCGEERGRRAIKGADGKPVRQPVALENGVAKPPCERPNNLYFQVYDAQDFGPTFGSVTTPAV